MPNVVTVLDTHAALGECPRWDEKNGLLYWVDIDNFRLNAFDPQTTSNRYLQLDEEIGCFALREQGGFVAALRSGFVLIDSLDGGITPLVDPEADKPWQRFNDGRCDLRGRFLAGTLNPHKDSLSGQLYQLSKTHACLRLTGGVHTANGLAFSPDGSTLYWTDTPQHVIWAYDYDLYSGQVSKRRDFFRFTPGFGRPDGAAVDSQGNYWSALYGGGRVVCISPGGELLQTIPVPALNPTMVAFGDADLQTLYITSCRAGTAPHQLAQYPQSGAIFSVRVDIPGLPEPRFAG